MPVVADPPPVLGLIGDPLRWQLVTELGRSDRRVGELVQLVGKPQNLVSYHLGELRRAGLVGSRRSSHDGRDVYYRVDLEQCRELLASAAASLHPGVRLAPAPPTDAVPTPRPKVLFLCTGNSARSQMAEALAEHRSGHTVVARSAGSHPKPLHPNAVRVMAARGIDISGRPTKPLTRFARTRFDRVITLCDKVREVCPELPGGPVAAHWSMPDPAASGASDDESYPAFEAIADELEVRVAFLLDDLRARPVEGSTHA